MLCSVVTMQYEMKLKSMESVIFEKSKTILMSKLNYKTMYANDCVHYLGSFQHLPNAFPIAHVGYCTVSLSTG
jgi:hypothetical protein